MSTPTKRSPRSGSRSKKNPRTRAQRLVRVTELTERMDARSEDIDEMALERAQVIDQLTGATEPGERASLAEIGRACDKSPQALHKSAKRAKAKAAKKAGQKGAMPDSKGDS